MQKLFRVNFAALAWAIAVGSLGAEAPPTPLQPQVAQLPASSSTVKPSLGQEDGLAAALPEGRSTIEPPRSSAPDLALPAVEGSINGSDALTIPLQSPAPWFVALVAVALIGFGLLGRGHSMDE